MYLNKIVLYNFRKKLELFKITLFNKYSVFYLYFIFIVLYLKGFNLLNSKFSNCLRLFNLQCPDFKILGISVFLKFFKYPILNFKLIKYTIKGMAYQ